MRGSIRTTARACKRGSIALVAVCAMTMSFSAIAQEKGGGKVNTGNDPRDFASKFMPYYRYTELENGLEQDSMTIFGMWAITKNLALSLIHI